MVNLWDTYQLQWQSSVKYTKHNLYSRPWAILDKFMPFVYIKEMITHYCDSIIIFTITQPYLLRDSATAFSVILAMLSQPSGIGRQDPL